MTKSSVASGSNWNGHRGGAGDGISSVIRGVGVYHPEQIVTTEEVEVRAGFDKFGIRKGMVRLFTGVEERRYARNDEQPSDLAAAAGADALQRAGIKPDEIDVIIFCAITNDFLEPAIANRVQEKLGARNAHCFDIKNACNAFMNGIDLADSLIKAGKARCVLVTSGEVLSRLLKFNCRTREDVERRSTSYSAADGGGAFVICGEHGTDKGIRRTAFRSFGELWNNNVNWGGGTMFPHDPDKFYFVGDTKELIAKAFDVVPALFMETLWQAGWPIDSINMTIGAQVATYLTKEMMKRVGVPMDNTVTILPTLGNTGAAGIPMATNEALQQGKIRDGDRVVLFGAGNGLSVGCICVQW